MAQIIEMFLLKMNVPREEVDLFTDQIKERKVGELFKHFEGWDIQAVRREAEKEVREAREEARKEARKEVKKEVNKETERGIQKLVKVIKELSGSRDTAIKKLMEEYGLTKESAEKKIASYW